jgi:hypothetical protein
MGRRKYLHVLLRLAYSRSPTASSASCSVRYHDHHVTLPSLSLAASHIVRSSEISPSVPSMRMCAIP